MLRVGFEPTISASERPKTYALDRAATGSGHGGLSHKINTAYLAEMWVVRVIKVSYC